MVKRPAEKTIITEDFQKLAAFVTELEAGKDPLDIAVPECGDWQNLANVLYEKYDRFYSMDKVKATQEYKRVLEREAKENPDLLLLLPQQPSLDINEMFDDDEEALIAAKSSNKMPPLEPFKHIYDKSTKTFVDVDATFGPGRGAKARKWLDKYIQYSAQMSTMGDYLFHEGAGLWVLSVVAARRIMLDIPESRYTPLYIAFAADTSEYAKSVTAGFGIELLRRTGLSWFILPKTITPEKYVQMGMGQVDEDFMSLSGEELALAENELKYSAQRSIYYDETGRRLAGWLSSQGRNSAWLDIFLEADSCPETLDNVTIARNNEKMKKVYLSKLICFTPDDYKSLPQKGSANPWQSGLLPRYILLTPARPLKKEEDEEQDGVNLSMWKRGPIEIHPDLIRNLQAFHKNLGEPRIEIVEGLDKNSKPNGKYKINRQSYPENLAPFDTGAFEAYANYVKSMRIILHKYKDSLPSELRGGYQRLPMKALRVAALLAFMDNGGVITVEHWAAAQEITERWRASMHEFLNQVSTGEVTQEKKREDQILRTIDRLGGWVKSAEIAQRCSLSCEQAMRFLESLVVSNVLIKFTIENKRGRKRLSDIYGRPASSMPEKYREKLVQQGKE